MSTRSGIAIKHKDQSYSVVYCHWDGYPSHHMPILSEFYKTKDQVEELIALGDLSILDKSMECPEGHSFDSPKKGYSVFYGRDRGEENCGCEHVISLFYLTKFCHKSGMAYVYIFDIDDNRWSWHKI